MLRSGADWFLLVVKNNALILRLVLSENERSGQGGNEAGQGKSGNLYEEILILPKFSNNAA